MATLQPLDNPVWHALVGPHATFAIAAGPARRYADDVAFFAGVDALDRPALEALAALAGDAAVIVARRTVDPIAPGDAPVTEAMRLVGHQYVLPDDVPLAEPPAGVTIERLDERDVPAMLALARATEPGPFFARTIVLGDYYGVRDDDRLVAMAGERLQLDGWCEISAVCTDPGARRRGLAAALTTEVARGIRARGRTPILHVVRGNDAACHLYESLGFRHRVDLDFVALRAAQ